MNLTSRNNYSSSPAKDVSILTYASKISQNSWSSQIKTASPVSSNTLKGRNTSSFSEDFPALPTSSSKTDFEQNKSRVHVHSSAITNTSETGDDLCVKTCWRDVLVNNKGNENAIDAVPARRKPRAQFDSSPYKDKLVEVSPQKKRNSRKTLENSKDGKKDLLLTEEWENASNISVLNNRWSPTITKPTNNELKNVLHTKCKSLKKGEEQIVLRGGKDHVPSDTRNRETKGFRKVLSKTDEVKIGQHGVNQDSSIDKAVIKNSSRDENKLLYTWNNKLENKHSNIKMSGQCSDRASNQKQSSIRNAKETGKITVRSHSETYVRTGQKCENSSQGRSRQKMPTKGEEKQTDEETVSATANKKRRKKRPSKIKRQAAMYHGKVVVVPAEFSAKLAGMIAGDEIDQKPLFKETVDVGSTSEFPELAAVNYYPKKRFDKREQPEFKEDSTLKNTSPSDPKIVSDEKEVAQETKVRLLNRSNPDGISLKVDIDPIVTKDQEHSKADNPSSSPVKSVAKENPKVKICPRDPVSLADIFATTAPKQKEKKKKNDVDDKPVTKKSSSQLQIINVLDSSGPVVKRGKEREKPKAKKPTQLKKIILKEREQRKEKLKNLVKAAEQYLKAQTNINASTSIEAFTCQETKSNEINKSSFPDEKLDESKSIIADSCFDFTPIEDIFGEHVKNGILLLSRSESHVPDKGDCVLGNNKNVDGMSICNEGNSNEALLEHEFDHKNDVVVQDSIVSSNSQREVDSEVSHSLSIFSTENNADEQECGFDDMQKSESFFKTAEVEEPCTDSTIVIEQYDKQVSDEEIENKQNKDLNHLKKNTISEIPDGIEIWKEITSNACEVCKDVFLKKNSVSRNSDCETKMNSVTEEERKKAIKIVMHTKNFREYCNHLLSKKLDECVQQLLEDLVRFQDRMHQKDPVKAHVKRRLVYGLKEVTKKCKLKKLKCIIIAPNVENIQSEGGLNDTLENLIRVAEEYHVPCIFALERKHLGKLCKKPVPVSCVGIFNYEGSEVSFKNTLELHEESLKDYKELHRLIQENINDDDVVNLIQANESAPGSLLGYRMKVLRSTLMKKKDGSSKSEVFLEYEKFISKYMIKI